MRNSRPTDAELAILSVLWERGPSTVREVWAELDSERTTVLKLMQIMTDKGLLVRDASRRPQLFRPKESRERMQKRLVLDLSSRAFADSTQDLVMRALTARTSTPEELRQIRLMIQRMEKEQRGKKP